MILTTAEQGLKQLLQIRVDFIAQEYIEAAKAYNLHTSEEDAVKLIIMAAEKKLADLKKIDEVEL